MFCYFLNIEESLYQFEKVSYKAFLSTECKTTLHGVCSKAILPFSLNFFRRQVWYLCHWLNETMTLEFEPVFN